ncbi:adenylate/guanylate cyclase domain-containing protein [Kitasatospora sp. NPDC088783]|uniref:adenylate/guanylate cyclase domain-containing protein n=1 Tax=Kitasatospora sp. NPDC088783 TaxID=3364077 RepID=UPI0038192617
MADERRLAAMLFADIVGSTSLADGMDPEDTRVLMGRYFEHAVAVVEAAEGRLEKFIGDAVVAVFGIPRAQGDEAERALRAALELRSAVQRDALLGRYLRMRVGVNLGEVMATSDSRSEVFIASGDAMNVAARLQESAEPDEILVSDRVFLATEDAFEFTAPRMVRLKGKDGPVRVHPVVAPRERRRAERPPMVGRRHDLLQLRLAADRVAEEGRSRLVTVLGVGGIGKTRLVEEFIAGLPLELGFEVVDASAHGQGGSDRLRSLLDGLVGSGLSTARVQHVFEADGYGAEESARRARDLMAALGSGGRLGEDGGTVLTALRLFIGITTRDRAVIIVLDEAHRAGDFLLDLMEQLAVSRGRSRLLVLVVARPELLDRRPRWGAGRDNHTSLTLQPLATAQIRTVVGSYLHQQPEELLELISQRSGGNPYYALEFVRSVSRLTGSGAGSTLGTALPDTVHAAVLARLDFLSPDAREVLRLVSVCGSVLPIRLYPDLLPDRTDHQIAIAVEELLAQDVLHLNSGRRPVIRQSFVRDVAEGTLTRAARIAVHAGAAGLLSGLAEDTDSHSILVGEHCLAALRLSLRSSVPAALPFQPAEAASLLARAGAASSRAGLSTEAQAFIEGALTLAGTDRRVELLELLATVAGVSAKAVASLEQAIEEAGEPDRLAPTGPETAVRLRRRLLLLWLRCGLMARLRVSRDSVLTRYTEAHRLAGLGISPDERMHLAAVDLFLVLDNRAVSVEDGAFVARTDPDALLAEGRAIADHFEGAGDIRTTSEVLDGCQFVAATMNRPDRVLEFCEQRTLLPDLPSRERADALAMLAAAHAGLGDPLAGLRAVEDEAVNRRYGTYSMHLAQPLAYGLSIAYAFGEWDTAERLSDYLVHAFEESSASPENRVFCLDGFFALIRIAMARGERDAANRFADLLSESTKDVQSLWSTTRALLAMELQDGPGDHDLDAATLGSHAFAVVSFHNERGLPSPSALIQAAATHSSARHSQVVEVATALRRHDHRALAECINTLENHGRRVAAARLRIVLADRTTDPAPLSAARHTLEKLRDARFLHRLAETEARIHGRQTSPRAT